MSLIIFIFFIYIIFKNTLNLKEFLSYTEGGEIAVCVFSSIIAIPH